jgi:hypothetical protein
MAISNETKELDKKKQTSSSDLTNTTVKSMVNFIFSLASMILLIILYFIFGSIILYECKLAQSNIVPTNLECYPYTNTYPEIKQIFTNIFITNTNPQESVKLSFPYNELNSKHSLLEMFRNYKEGPNSNFLINYIISIIEGLINYNNNSITTFFNLLNQIPEILIVTLGPIISLFYFIITPILGIFVFIYYYFMEMNWLFKINVKASADGKPIWKDVNLLSPVGYVNSFILAFVFFMLFWVLLFTAAPFACIILFYLCFLMTFGYTGEINNKIATMGTIIKGTFINYKVIIAVTLSLFIVLTSFSNLGVVSGIFSLFIVLLIYFNFIKLNIFESTTPNNLSPLTSSNQAIKKCPLGKSKTMMSTFTNFLDDMKGVGIGKDLKKLSKKFMINE